MDEEMVATGDGRAAGARTGQRSSCGRRGVDMDVTDALTMLISPEGRANPYPIYAALHEIGEAVALGPDQVLVVGYDAVNSVLRDPGFRVSEPSRSDETLQGWRADPAFVQSVDWILN